MHPNNKSISIRNRLLWSLLILISIAWIVAVFISYIKTKQEIEGVLDNQLVEIAYSLLNTDAGNHTTTINIINNKISKVPNNSKVVFQVWKNKELVSKSENAPKDKIAIKEGFSNLSGKKKWRVFSLNKGSIQVKVGHDFALRNKLVSSVVLTTLLPLFLLLPVIAILILITVNMAFVPLYKITDAIKSRSYNKLTPINIADTPTEVIPVIESLNKFLLDLDNSFETEKSFTSNAAHELRTPLSVLKAQAQVAIRCKNESEKHEALNNIIAGVDRISHMVNQLLLLAKVDPDTSELQLEMINLKQVATSVIEDTINFAINKNIEVSLSANDIYINGYENILKVMLRNILDNAIRYTDNNGKVSITIKETENTATITIEDNGVGIPKEEYNKIFDRFYRLPSNNKIGCGIGMAIVKRIVDIHKAEITLNSPIKGNGLVVNIKFKKNIKN